MCVCVFFLSFILHSLIHTLWTPQVNAWIPMVAKQKSIKHLITTVDENFYTKQHISFVYFVKCEHKIKSVPRTTPTATTNKKKKKQSCSFKLFSRWMDKSHAHQLVELIRVTNNVSEWSEQKKKMCLILRMIPPFISSYPWMEMNLQLNKPDALVVRFRFFFFTFVMHICVMYICSWENYW